MADLMAQTDSTGPDTPETSSTDDVLSLTLLYHGRPIALDFASSSTISDLSNTISSDLQIPPENQKLLISPKPGLLRPPFKDPTLSLSSIVNRKITLLGSTSAEVADLDASIALIKARQASRTAALRAGRKVQANKSHDWKKASEEASYTFHTITPLSYLQNPSKSHRFLERLAQDPGVKASMRKHQFSVGLLTEMNPAEHTTHESRTLGLNRNRGEVIELRLRTDAYDGYRDYKVIRKTLCHELAHNVWGDHDRNFWDLCKEIEKEVEKGDWTRGGHSVGGEEFYNPGDEGVDDDADGGGWIGGSLREVMASAAEERMKKEKALADAAKRDSQSGPSKG